MGSCEVEILEPSQLGTLNVNVGIDRMTAITHPLLDPGAWEMPEKTYLYFKNSRISCEKLSSGGYIALKVAIDPL